MKQHHRQRCDAREMVGKGYLPASTFRKVSRSLAGIIEVKPAAR